MNATRQACLRVVVEEAPGKTRTALTQGAVSMDDCPRTDNAVDQSDQELLIFTVSDEELEKAAGITTWAQTYPQTCSSLSRPYIDGTPVPVEEPSTASKADIGTQPRNVRFVPKADILRCSEERRYSITSSEIASTPDGADGMVKASALAVLRLITSSNVVGWIIGRSAG